jgi:hypothetical protein
MVSAGHRGGGRRLKITLSSPFYSNKNANDLTRHPRRAFGSNPISSFVRRVERNQDPQVATVSRYADERSLPPVVGPILQSVIPTVR